MKRLFIFLLLMLPLGVLQVHAQQVRGVALSGLEADSLGINTDLAHGVEQIAWLEVTLRYTFAQGDTLHASPAETAIGRFALMNAAGQIIVQSRIFDVAAVPASILPNADKVLARDFMDAVCDALASRRADLDGCQ